MNKENINKTAEEKKPVSPETGPELPATPEAAQEGLKEAAEESLNKLDEVVEGQKGLEGEASGAEEVPGSKEIDEKKASVVKEGKKDIERVKKENYEQGEGEEIIIKEKQIEKNNEKDKEAKQGEKPKESEVKEGEKKETSKEEIKFNDEVIKAIEELGLKKDDLEKMESFTSLSEGAQMLVLKNYDQILVDDAIKMTPEKIAQIKQARKERYQAKLGQKKGAFMAGIRNFFGSGKRQDKAFKESYEQIKNKEDEGNKKLALEAAVNWVANFDIPAKLEDGKVKLEFVEGSKLGEEQQALVDELNEAANKFARMPQYMSNISATKRHRNKYEKAQLELENKKIELETSLAGEKMEEEIIAILGGIDNKVSNLQNNLTDKEREEFEKSDSWLMKNLKSKGFERVSYLVGGGTARYMIRSRLAEDATEDAVNAAGSAASGLATAYTLGVAAAIGGIRGWQREKKRIREEDKKIGKQEYQETEEMSNRKKALSELKDVTPDFLKLFKERKDPQEGETWEAYQNRTIAEWLKEDPENAKIYLAKKEDFDKANEAFLKTQKKKFLEFKTEANFVYAKSASQKIEKLVNDIYKLQDQENISNEDKEKLNKKIEMLQTRIDYTQNKIDDGLIALGTSQNRLTHSTELFNILAQANLLVETLEHENEDLPKKATDIIGDEFINDDGTINIKAWSESASPEDLALYRQIKIKNFLDSQDDKVDSERTKSKMKKAAIGAVSGAGLAFVGMKTMGYLMDTEAGNYVKEKIGDAISYGIDQGRSGLEAVTSLFGGSEELAEAMPTIDEVDAITGAAEGTYSVPEDSPEFVGPVQPDGIGEILDTATKSFEELKESGALSKLISNEGLKEGQTDSIWRSAREIFTRNAQDLGYEGDMDDAGALRKWADNMTANAINRMDDVTDKVFEGNIISLDQNEAGEYVIEVEQGEGLKPGYLPEKDVDTPSRVEPMEKIPRREINEIPHTYKLPDEAAHTVPLEDDFTEPDSEEVSDTPEISQTETSSHTNELPHETPADSDVPLDDLQSQAESELDQDTNEQETPDTESRRDNLSDVVNKINEEGGVKSGVEESLERAREVADQEAINPSLDEDSEISSTEDVNISDERGSYQESSSSETVEDGPKKTTTESQRFTTVINNPEFISENKDMAEEFVKTFTQEAKKIPSEFFNNPNEIYKVRGLGETSFAEQFEKTTKFDFNKLNNLEQKRVLLWFKTLENSSMKKSPAGIRSMANTVIAPLRQKYGF
jgi:hypothetical protein